MDSQTLIAKAYDETHYESSAFLQTHPETLAAIGLLFGLQPVHPAHGRVLEIGCALGDNLIPMALNAPDSQFVGVDISSSQIDVAAERAARLGLRNIKFYSGSIEHLPDSAGPFDYIICHGVFSWVPESVQSAILERIRNLLSPQGIAYISYNTYPGWHFRDVLKHAIRFHGRHAKGLDEQHEALKEIADLLAEQGSSREDTPTARIARVFRKQLDALPPSYLVHEYYEPFNIPLYFSQFADMLATHQLKFVGEAHMMDNFPLLHNPELQEKLLAFSGAREEFEQYADLLLSRSFRSSLVTHSTNAVNPNIHPDRIRPFYFISDFKPAREDTASLAPDKKLKFHSRGTGQEIKASTPITKAALTCLWHAWPLGFNFNDLVHHAYKVLSRDINSTPLEEVKKEALQLCQDLLELYAGGHLRFPRVSPPLCTNQVSSAPLLSPVARQQLQNSESGQVTNQLHCTVRLEPLVREVALLCNGQRSQTEIEVALTGILRSRGTELGIKPELLARPEGAAKDAVRLGLAVLRDHALLVG